MSERKTASDILAERGPGQSAGAIFCDSAGSDWIWTGTAWIPLRDWKTPEEVAAEAVNEHFYDWATTSDGWSVNFDKRLAIKDIAAAIRKAYPHFVRTQS